MTKAMPALMSIALVVFSGCATTAPDSGVPSAANTDDADVDSPGSRHESAEDSAARSARGNGDREQEATVPAGEYEGSAPGADSSDSGDRAHDGQASDSQGAEGSEDDVAAEEHVNAAESPSGQDDDGPEDLQSGGDGDSPSIEPPATARETRIVASHGSAVFHLPPDVTNLTVDGPSGFLSLDVTTDTVEVGWLEPNSSYRYQALTADAAFEGAFATIQSPYAWLSPDRAEIYPGAYLDAGCTLGFILRDSTNETWYAITAGHCNSERAGSTYFGDGVRLGTHVAQGQSDWQAYELTDQARNLTSAALAHWTGPGPMEGTVRAGDTVCMYGWGGLNGVLAAVEGTFGQPHYGVQARCGTFHSAEPAPHRDGNADSFKAFLAIDQGDSGGPVIDAESGAPLGLVTSGISYASATVTTLCAVLDGLSQQGLNLRVVGYAYTPPDQTIAPAQAMVGVLGGTPYSASCE